MNYWKQFAEMLGLELGEEFSLTDNDGNEIDGHVCKFTENGFLYKSQISKDWYHQPSNILERILYGTYKAVPKPWKPTCGESYWYYSEAFKKAISVKWEDGFNDFIFWKVGNCFRTKEAATVKGKEIMEAIQKEYEEA